MGRARAVASRLACLLFLLGLGPTAAMAQLADAVAIKAVFLARFGSFVGWPAAAFPAADTPLTICVADSAPLLLELERAARGETASGRPISVRAVRAPSRARDCHILFAGARTTLSVAAYLNAVRGRPVLTITDIRNGGVRGVIHFVIVENRVRFHIDQAAAQRQGLRLNARLLDVALTVRGRGAP